MFHPSFASLDAACQELLNSETLKRLLDEALIMGNYINGDAGSSVRTRT